MVTQCCSRGFRRVLAPLAALVMSGFCLELATPARAQGSFMEFAGATGSLNGSFRMPSTARLSDGRFVVAMHLQGKPLITSGTYFQMYTSLGQIAGGFTRVKPMLAMDDAYPKVIGVGSGFVVVYNWREHIDSPQQIRAQRYSAAGVKVGSEFRINTTNPGHITQHRLARLADGGFVAVWGAGPNKSNSGEIYARRYNSNGVAVTGQFIVNTTLLRTQDNPTVAGLADGGFVVTWNTTLSNGSIDIYAQRYAATGAKVGAELKLTQTFGATELTPVVAGFRNGGFVVVWTDIWNMGVYGRRFTAAGAPNGATFLVGEPNYGGWETIGLSMLDDDRFLVAYSKSSYNIYAKLFGPTAAGDSTATEFRVNSTTTAGSRMRPSLVALSNRNMFAVWEYKPGLLIQTRLRRLDFPPLP